MRVEWNEIVPLEELFTMQTYFHEIADAIQTRLEGHEVFTCQFSAEDSDFVRFNKSAVRQAGSVTQYGLAMDLIEGQRHATGGLTLSGDAKEDRGAVARLIRELREQRAAAPDDPHLLYATDVSSGEVIMKNRLPDSGVALAEILQAGEGRDLVGLYAAGGIHRGFANSFEQRNWYSNYSFNLDWSFYHRKDKAVKTGYAGFEWESKAFKKKVDWASEQLAMLKQEPRTIEPGVYRVYLAPAALKEIVGILAWGGFGLKAHRTKQTPFLRMIEGDARMNPILTIAENTAEGVAPNFQSSGFLKPDRVTLIKDGVYKDCLISPRSAKEYEVPTNGASDGEMPQSLEIDAGDIPESEILERLDTGIYINNLWYLNYSDRTACRITGMTRFATFWVEHGKIVAPLNVMRFDETAYRMLGENLIGLSAERETLLSASTYFERSVGSSRLPGALVKDFTLTL